MKLSNSAVVFFSLILVAVSFFAGSQFGKSQPSGNTSNTTTAQKLVTKQTDKPQLEFFVMSFCPYGNQIEDAIRPAYDLLSQKADFIPRYIFDKIDNLESYCQSRSGDPSQCDLYVKNGYFKTEVECKKVITESLATCKDEKNYIKSETGVYYGSLHGRSEANQNIREICAFNLVEDKKIWWDFVGGVNKNCSTDNVDSCWEQQGRSAGLDTQKITECFNQQAFSILEEQISHTNKYQVTGSPTVLINGVKFPPESAYKQDGSGSLLINGKVATQDRYRSPNVIKEAVCASMNKTAKECKTTLNDLSGSAPAAGGC